MLASDLEDKEEEPLQWPASISLFYLLISANKLLSCLHNENIWYFCSLDNIIDQSLYKSDKFILSILSIDTYIYHQTDLYYLYLV